MLTYITKAFFFFLSMLTGYLERDHLMGLCWHTFKKYADRLFRKRSSHGPMLAYLMLHLQVGIRTQTWTEIAILSLFSDYGQLRSRSMVKRVPPSSHTWEKGVMLVILSPQIFWIFRQILGWERDINTALSISKVSRVIWLKSPRN